MRKGSKYWYANNMSQFEKAAGPYTKLDVNYVWRGEEFVQLNKKIAENKLERTLEILADQAKEDCPKDTRRLKHSIRTWEPRWEGTWCHGAYGIPKTYKGTDMSYGFYQEVGFQLYYFGTKTRRHIRNSYLVPALTKARPKIQALWRV